jgi:predicted double-glycine peptidase
MNTAFNAMRRYHAAQCIGPALQTLALFTVAGLIDPAYAGTLLVPDANGLPLSISVSSLQEQRFATTVRQKYDFSCGSAALATLLSYQYDAPVTEDRIFEEMFKHGDQAKIRREGFSLLDMKLYLEAHGYAADGYKVPLERLQQAGIPAIVLISENGYNHFVVIKGIAAARVLVGDPSKGTRTIARSEFEQMWSNHILFVIHHSSTSARFNDTSDWDKAPLSPLAGGINRDGLGRVAVSKFGPGGF